MFRKSLTPRVAGRIGLRVVQIFAACHMFNEYVLEVRVTHGLSMLPTFAFSNNWIAVENLTRTLPFLRSMQRGDIVAFIQPQTLDPVTKRVIGLPGDEIMLEPQDADSRFVRVPKGHVWLEGDNRTTSRDSREYGPVPIALLRGRVFAQIWPQQRFLYPAPSWPATETRMQGSSSVKLKN